MADLQRLKREEQERQRSLNGCIDLSDGRRLLLKPERLRGAKVRWPKARLD